MSLLPPATTSLERAVAETTARLSRVETPLRNLWNPDTCPEALLPWLAWSLGVDTWKSYWPASVKRSLLRNAVNIKRRKGTALSVRETVEAFGASVALREGWESNPPGPPHSFRVTINANSMGDQPVTAEFQQDIIDEVQRNKPVRSYFTVTAGVSARLNIGIAAVARAATYHRLELNEHE
ncbi:phage tail protein I [Marinimicrobium sp. ARAG 43.8]|uniref:phage tail protein I n=1 Tax=Marinimicrobium sp. ARAG 43.8 TaxID=3418719 RepID=UPI003CF76C10